jgi:hypothetical protein
MHFSWTRTSPGVWIRSSGGFDGLTDADVLTPAMLFGLFAADMFEQKFRIRPGSTVDVPAELLSVQCSSCVQ